MSSREEALRRIFEATGEAGRLTDDQKRELLAHLEDAVETKVRAGVPEMDAVGRAFEELGDVRKIAKQFPAPAPVAVTAEGPRFLADNRAYAWMGLSFLVFFVVLGWFVTPRFAAIFHQVKVPMPGFTRLFLGLSEIIRSAPVAVGAFLMIVVAGILCLRRRAVPPAVSFALLVVSVGLCLGLMAAMFLPLLSLLEGIGGR